MKAHLEARFQILADASSRLSLPKTKRFFYLNAADNLSSNIAKNRPFWVRMYLFGILSAN